jgi:murein L,D-transpeptidase YcbB/YkuD
MGMLRSAVIVIAGALTLCTLSVSSSAGKGTDNWQINQSFQRAQGLRLQNFSGRRKKYRRREYSGLFFSDDDFGFFQPRRYGRTLQKQRRKRLIFEGIDPEPGRPRSPDEGFGTYQPPKLVALSNPKLEAPKPDQVLPSTIWHEIRQAETAVRVTAQQRDAIINFYRLNNFAPLWVNSEGFTEKGQRTLKLLSKADEEGLNPLDYLPPTLGSFNDQSLSKRGDVVALARLDIGLTAMAVRYAEHLHSGRIIPKKLSGYYDLVPPSLDLGQTLYELSYRVLPDLYLTSLAPTHRAYAAMKSTLAGLRAEASQEERALIPAGARVKAGGRDARVVLVRARMVELGLLSKNDAASWKQGSSENALDTKVREETLDKKLSKALKAFQAEHKIKQTGWLDKATVEALNARSDHNNAKRLAMNMERLRWMPRDLGKKHVFVNQAAFELRMVDRDSIRWTTKVIVGKPDTQTAVFSDEMETVVINPYWGVPQSIIRYELMPYLARDRRYLDRLGYEVLNSRGKRISSRSVNWWAYGSKIPFSVRQPPGDDNALGRIKFLFPNAHDIYMHDTPTKKLFSEGVRAFSHGCVRVENPRQFAEHVLGWERKRIDDMIATGENKNVSLAEHIPVHLNYFTAWPDASGKVVFYPDIYKRDTRLDKALNTVTVAANN